MITIASYNVHKCVGTDFRRSPSRVAAVIAELGADILALQEVDRRFGRRAGLLDEAAIWQSSGLRLLRFSDLPDGHGWHGNAVLVADGIEATGWSRLDLPGFESRGAVVVELDVRGTPLRVAAMHLGLMRSSRVLQAQAVLRLMAANPAEGDTVLMGDLNEMRAGAGALGVLAPLFGTPNAAPSFPAFYPRLSLDRMLCSREGALSRVQAHDTPLARLASDHLPLKGQLRR